MRWVAEASYAGGHKLRIVFDDGSLRVVDLAKHLVGPVFVPLRDQSYFRRFQLNRDIDTVVWPNGADFSPDFLYEIGEAVVEPRHSADSGNRCG